MLTVSLSLPLFDHASREIDQLHETVARPLSKGDCSQTDREEGHRAFPLKTSLRSSLGGNWH